MPGYKTHQLVGVGLVFLMFVANQSMHFLRHVALGPLEFIVVGLIALFYSIFPDIDIGTSKSRQLVLGGGLLMIIYCFLTNWPVLGIVVSATLLVILLLHHRGRTHSTTAALVFAAPLVYLHWIYALVALVAYTSHLLLDRELKIR